MTKKTGASKGGGARPRNNARVKVKTSPLHALAYGKLPMWPAMAACGVFYVVVALYTAYSAGYMTPLVDQAMRSGSFVGLDVRQIDVRGVDDDVRRAQIVSAIGVDLGDSIIWLDTHAARARVEALPWVAEAAVSRLLPASLKVTVVSRKGLAIWQRTGRFAVIDAAGNVIAETLEDRFVNLPLVVGDGANREAKYLLQLLDRHPTLRARLRAAVRVADRRWNLRLINEVDIRLPEGDPATALAELAALDQAYGLLSRDINVVDLRLKDRLTVRLTDEAALRRSALMNGQPASQTATHDTQDIGGNRI